MKRIKYIIRKRALGDVLWIEPVIRQLSEQNEQLIVHTRYNELFANYPARNVVFKNRLTFLEKLLVNTERMLGTSILTANLDGAYEKKPGIHFLHAYQQKAGLPRHNEYPHLYLSANERSFRPVEKPYVVLHAESFSTQPYRALKNFDWQLLADQIRGRGYEVIQAGIGQEALQGVVTLKTSIRQLMGCLYNAAAFVGIDSGPSHIAASLGVPSLIFFGALDPRLRHFPELFKGVLVKQPCSPECTNAISDKDQNFCAVAPPGTTPPCCQYNSDFISKQFDLFLSHYVPAHPQ